MIRRIVWTISLAAAGVFLTARSAPVHTEWMLLGAVFGGLIGLGFGTIFSTPNNRVAILYWALTFGLFGSIYGLEEPIGILRLAIRTGGGIAIGVFLGGLRYLVGSSRRQPKSASR